MRAQSRAPLFYKQVELASSSELAASDWPSLAQLAQALCNFFGAYSTAVDERTLSSALLLLATPKLAQQSVFL